MTKNSRYTEFLYPLQDEVLAILTPLATGFYLTGGTAASRGYLQHRYSEDLDFFVNNDDRFTQWADQILNALDRHPNWQMTLRLKGERYVGLTILRGEVELRIDFVNDVPSHIGTIVEHPVLGPIDSAENILANKVTALLGREEPKDLADVWGFCTQMHLALVDAIEGAHSKAAGIYPADLARVLCSATEDDWKLIRWINAPDPTQFVADLRALGEDLIL